MIERLLPLGLAGLMMVGLANLVAAQPPESSPEAVNPTQQQLKKAFQAANAGKFTDAVALIDGVLKKTPDDRDGLFLMAFIASLAADKEKSQPDKLGLLRRSGAAYKRLQEKYKPLTDEEKRLGDSTQLDAARVAALDGKPEQALDIIAQLVASGFRGLPVIDVLPDFESVRKLPNFHAKLAQANEGAIKTMLADFSSFPFDFDLKTVDGKPIKLADFKGNVTIVDVWGTWCPPCRKEIPHFVDLANRFGAKGLKIVGINCNESGSPAEVKQTINDFIAETKIPYPCVLNDDTIQTKIPDFEGYPTTLFLDRTGKVRLSQVGYQPMARLEAIVTALLAEPTP